MLTIRLARGGRVHNPIYTIVATDSRNGRDGRFNEKLGQYAPKAKTELSGVNTKRIEELLAQGATISDTVKSIFKRNKLA